MVIKPIRIFMIDLCQAVLAMAKLDGAAITDADLSGAYLNGADLSRSDIENAFFLKGTDLRGVTGLTKEQLKICKAKGAIMDGDTRPTPVQSMAASLSKPRTQ